MRSSNAISTFVAQTILNTISLIQYIKKDKDNYSWYRRCRHRMFYVQELENLF